MSSDRTFPLSKHTFLLSVLTTAIFLSSSWRFLVYAHGTSDNVHRLQSNNIFASMEQIKQLSGTEFQILDQLQQYISYTKDHLDKLQSLVDKTKIMVGEPLGQGDPSSPSESLADPLQVFSLIERFATDWRNVEMMLQNMGNYSNQVLSDIQHQTSDLKITEDDLEGSLMSLARLQQVYHLSLPHLLNGSLTIVHNSEQHLEHLSPNTGHHKKVLSQQTAVSVGEAVLKYFSGINTDDRIDFREGYGRCARLWFESAMKHSVPPLATPAQIYNGLGRSFIRDGEYLKGLDYMKRSLELEPSRGRDYLSNLATPVDTEVINAMEDENYPRNKYMRLCSQSVTELSHSRTHPHNHALQCSHMVESRGIVYMRYNVEWLHLNPDLIIIHDFISDTEQQTLINIARNQLIRANVGNGMITTSRLGKVAWLGDNIDVVRRISQRIEDATGLDMNSAEQLQMSNYGIGGHYEAHYDFDINRYNENRVHSVVGGQLGDRIATFMLYLTDVKAGGATVFPRLNLAVRPVKNAGVFWYNYRRNGEMELDALHGACPVLIGEKWVANKWIHERGQEFRRPCDTDPTL